MQRFICVDDRKQLKMQKQQIKDVKTENSAKIINQRDNQTIIKTNNNQKFNNNLFPLMSKVTIVIGFYLQGQHYAQMQAFLPRVQAIKIPQLQIEKRAIQKPQESKLKRDRAFKVEQSKSEKSQSKKVQSDQDAIDQQEDLVGQIDNQQDDQGEDQDAIVEEEQLPEEKIDSEKEEEDLLRQWDEEEDSEDDEEDLSDDQDISSISRSMSQVKSYHKTKRQKGDRVGLMQLPDRRPRKDKNLDQATEVIRRQEKQRKRKQYLKKQVQAQQKATLDKILNQTGRKLKLRQQKQHQDVKKKQEKQFKTLGDTPKIITSSRTNGDLIMLHNTKLFSQEMTQPPIVRQKPICGKCGMAQGRYKLKNSKIACSLQCYKMLA